MKIRKVKESGSALVYAIIVVMVVTILCATVGTMAIIGYRNSAIYTKHNKVKLIAESGIDKGIYYLNNTEENVIPDIDPDDPLVTGYTDSLNNVESKVAVQRDITDTTNNTYIITSTALDTGSNYKKEVRVKVHNLITPLGGKLLGSAFTIVNTGNLQVTSEPIEIYGEAYIKSDTINFAGVKYFMKNGDITIEAKDEINVMNSDSLEIQASRDVIATDNIINPTNVNINGSKGASTIKLLSSTLPREILNLNSTDAKKNGVTIASERVELNIYHVKANGQVVIFYSTSNRAVISSDIVKDNPDVVFNAYIDEYLDELNNELDKKKIFKVLLADSVNINDNSSKENYIIYSKGEINSSITSTFYNSNIYGQNVVNNGITVYGLNNPATLALPQGYVEMNDEIKKIIYEYIADITVPSSTIGGYKRQFNIVEYQ